MGRAPCCEKVGLKRGRWTAEEDETLVKYIQANGEGSWRSLPKNAGLLRCGKSCRLRWINYLRADLKRGNISAEEEEMIIKLHTSLGNRWSLIAGHLPGRTDNEIKNYWNSHLSRRIHTFRRPISTSHNIEAAAALPRVVMDLAKLNTPGPIIKRKGGRTSRASMKKNKKLIPSSSKNLKLMPPSILLEEKTSTESKEGGGGGGYEGMTHKSNQEKENLISAIEEQVEEERESMVLDSYEEGEERESLITSGHCQDSGGGVSEEREGLILYPNGGSNEEIESGFLCPSFGDDHVHELLCPSGIGIGMDNIGEMDTSGILNERENGVSYLINSSSTGSNEDQGGKISSSTGTGDHENEYWQLYSSSCFDQDDWVHKNWDWNWNWEGGHVVEDHQLNVWGEKEKEMLSWLWEESDNDIGGGGGGGGDETLFKDCEKQQALNAWLLS